MKNLEFALQYFHVDSIIYLDDKSFSNIIEVKIKHCFEINIFVTKIVTIMYI